MNCHKKNDLICVLKFQLSLTNSKQRYFCSNELGITKWSNATKRELMQPAEAEQHHNSRATTEKMKHARQLPPRRVEKRIRHLNTSIRTSNIGCGRRMFQILQFDHLITVAKLNLGWHSSCTSRHRLPNTSRHLYLIVHEHKAGECQTMRKPTQLHPYCRHAIANKKRFTTLARPDDHCQPQAVC